MTLIHYNGQIAAVVGATGFHLAPHLEDRPAGDPECCVVAFMAAYALDVKTGRLPGPYTDEKAGVYARGALIDDATFRALAGHSDPELARRFNVPEHEIAAKRADIVDGPAGFGTSVYRVELASVDGRTTRIVPVRAASEGAAREQAENAYPGLQAIGCSLAGALAED